MAGGADLATSSRAKTLQQGSRNKCTDVASALQLSWLSGTSLVTHLSGEASLSCAVGSPFQMLL